MFRVEDVQQVVYQRVFMGTEDHSPRVAQYAGRGSFRSWIRVMAVRLAQNLLQSQLDVSIRRYLEPSHE